MTRLFALALSLALGAALVPASAAPDANAPTAGVKPSAAPGDLGMAIMSARVQSDGTLLGGEGASYSAQVPGFVGAYEIGFGRDVTQCTYAVTPQVRVIAYAQPRFGVSTAVFVQISNVSDAAGVNLPFSVIVYCGR